MFIKDVCQLCHVTKKALDYYEDKGLISPNIMDNGYRQYSEKDIKIIKEICVLRNCGISVSDIKEVLLEKNKKAVIQKYQYINDLHIENCIKQKETLERLIQNYDIENEFKDFIQKDDYSLSIKEKLILAFPGYYGIFLSLHFGRFLNERVDTEDKYKAYMKMVEYLDHVVIPQKLENHIKIILNENQDISTLEQQVYLHTKDMLHNPDNYLQKYEKQLTDYIAYKLSDEYQNSFAKEVQEEIAVFQNSTGYQEHFIENLKILSSSYREYLYQLETVHKKLLNKFPQVQQLS